jgi:hypothetical protein
MQGRIEEPSSEPFGNRVGGREGVCELVSVSVPSTGRNRDRGMTTVKMIMRLAGPEYPPAGVPVAPARSRSYP